MVFRQVSIELGLLSLMIITLVTSLARCLNDVIVGEGAEQPGFGHADRDRRGLDIDGICVCSRRLRERESHHH